MRVIIDILPRGYHYGGECVPVTPWLREDGMSASTIAGLATLPAAEASRVVNQHPELADTSAEPLIVAVAARNATEAALLTDVLSVLKSRLSEDRHSREHVLRALLPAERLFTLSPAVLEQVNRNAAAHAALAAEFGLLSSTQVAERAKSKSLASNPAALANRWRQEQKVFAVDVDGVQRFPGFQFGGNGRPLPVIADVLAAVGDRLTGWELALWFTGGNGWLGGKRPVDVLDGDPELVVEAASRLAAEILI